MDFNKEKIENLLAKMTLEEKIGQMYQLDVRYFNINQNLDSPLTGPEVNKLVSDDIMYNIGSVLNATDGETSYQIQKKYLKNNRLQIPLLFMYDIIHGFRTIFPIPLSLACSWDPSLIEKTASIAGKEGSVSGINVAFSPMADLSRDSRWGRVMESCGEDPLLNHELTAAFVRGYQGDNLKENYKIASCIKHFAGYGAAEAGRDYNTVDMSEGRLRNFYLAGYEGGVNAGAEMVMTAFNSFNGIPATANKFLMNKILRQEWNFTGVTISDYNSVEEMVSHSFARNKKQAAQKAIEAQLDMEMVSTAYIENLKQLLEENIVKEEQINKAVRRILILKDKLGLFDDPFRYIKPEEEKKYHLCHKHREISRKAAANSMVLLKNEDILPLSKETASVGIIGPFADTGSLLGAWHGCGKEEETVTLRQGIKNKLGENTQIMTEPGCDLDTLKINQLEKAVQIAEKSEVIILALGEPQQMSGEAKSRATLKLPGEQKQLAQEILKLNKPTVLVLFNGRPLALKWYQDHIPAILEAWFPGTEGGNAVADIIFGDVNPGGKLTMSFPYTVGQLPLYYNHYNTGRPVENADDDSFVSRYLDTPNKPLYPFGYGLSYTDFYYSDFQINREDMNTDEKIEVSGVIENRGDYAGKEIVQLYIRDCVGSVVRPVKELKDYRKIELNPGEKKTVTFEIDKDMLCYYNSSYNKNITEPGQFKVFAGPNSEEIIECGNFVYSD